MSVVIFLSLAISALTVATGYHIYKVRDEKKVKSGKKVLKVSISAYAILVALFLLVIMPGAARAADNQQSSSGIAYLAAALSTGIATIGAGYAVGAVGSSALGAVSEDPGILGKTLIFVGLAEGIAIYGLIVSIMILGSL
ncbi:MAG: ATPase [Thermoanaerobacterales bacterium]|nr:ATPase [Thermoanaerobacterales bacterium]